MAMKMYKKDKLDYKNGYIVKGDKVIGIDNRIVAMLNEVETDIQRKQFEDANPVKPVEERPEFCRATEHGKPFVHVEAETPELDKMVAKTMKLMDEVDDMDSARKINEYMCDIRPLVQWVEDEHVVTCNQQTQLQFDLPNIGNPLELDKDTLLDWVADLF